MKKKRAQEKEINSVKKKKKKQEQTVKTFFNKQYKHTYMVNGTLNLILNLTNLIPQVNI